jgi:hypothetical protein
MTRGLFLGNDMVICFKGSEIDTGRCRGVVYDAEADAQNVIMST